MKPAAVKVPPWMMTARTSTAFITMGAAMRIGCATFMAERRRWSVVIAGAASRLQRARARDSAPLTRTGTIASMSDMRLASDALRSSSIRWSCRRARRWARATRSTTTAMARVIVTPRVTSMTSRKMRLTAPKAEVSTSARAPSSTTSRAVSTDIVRLRISPAGMRRKNVMGSRSRCAMIPGERRASLVSRRRIPTMLRATRSSAPPTLPRAKAMRIPTAMPLSPSGTA